MSILPLWIRFPLNDRITTWALIGDLLDSGFEIEKSLPVARAVLKGQGKHRQARLLGQLEPGLQDGSFVHRVQSVTSGSEAIVFGAYGNTDAAQVFRGAARVAGIRQRLGKAVRVNASQPLFLMAMFYLLLWGAGRWMIPAFEAFQPKGQWPPLAAIVGRITTTVHEHNTWIIALIALMCAAVYWLCGHWTNTLRVQADRLAPFSLVRFIAGTGFLFTVIEAAQAGVDLNQRLFERMAQNATPYERHRIGRIAHMMQGGHGFGSAMAATGHGFPSPDLIPIVEALENTPDWDRKLATYLERWIVGTEDAVERAMAGLNKVVMLCLGGAIAAVFSALFQLITLASKTGF